MHKLLFVIIPLLLAPTFAYADFIPYMTWEWDRDPIVCLNAADSTLPYMNDMVKAITIWKDKLNQNTGTHNFNYKVYVDKHGSQTHNGICTLIINTEVPKDLSFPKNAIGYTNCEGTPLNCVITIFDNTPSNYLAQTIEHEMGHALGIGHRLAFTKCDFIAVVISNDVMISQAGKFRFVTPADIGALTQEYGHDGFGGSNIVSPPDFVINPKPVNCTL